MIPENLKTSLILPLIATVAFVLIVCGGNAQEAAPSSPTTIPTTSTPVAPTPAPAQIATPVPPTPTATPIPPSPTLTSTPIFPATATATAVQAPPDQATETLLEEKTFTFLEHLTAEFSPRESATHEELAAAHFLRNRLEYLDYDVYIQEFDVSRLLAKVEYSPGSVSGPDVIETLPIVGSFEGSGTGNLADVGMAFEEDIPSQGLDGKVALIERGTITFQEKVNRVAEAGAVAAIVFNNQQGNFRGAFRSQSPIPAVSLTRADGQKLLDLMNQGETSAIVSVQPTFLPSRNVIAEKPGNSESGGIVIVGAHYDTTPDTQGANDNGSGLSVVMTIAEFTADTEYPFTLRFVLFGSEEIGLFGSRHYVDALSEDEIAGTLAMLNFDVPGSGDRLNFEGSRELTDRATEIVAEIGAKSARATLPEGASSDHAPFYDVGIPVIFILANDLSRINSPADDIEWVNPTLMGWSAELGIRLLDRLAQDSAP
ncbi:MAG: M28 family peptidase [Dehalococcoidia bacterium]|nr:M28 family peptidase [Dehalococcoidia bacterium]